MLSLLIRLGAILYVEIRREEEFFDGDELRAQALCVESSLFPKQEMEFPRSMKTSHSRMLLARRF